MSGLFGTVASGSAHVGRLGGGQPLDIPVLRILMALSICLTIAALAVLLMRQRRGHDDLRRWTSALAGPARAVDVVEMRRLGVHADIGLVRHGGREYLLVVHSGGTQVLHAGEVPSLGAARDEVP